MLISKPGSGLTYSYAGVPALSVALSPSTGTLLVCQQWKKMYALGRASSPPIAVISASCFGWVWWHTSEVAYAAAAGSVFLMIPWTLLVMMPTNNLIEARARPHEEEDLDGAVLRVRQLLRKWSVMNYIRAVFPLAGGIVGLVTALP
jgi:noranthrone monooxygenase